MLVKSGTFYTLDLNRKSLVKYSIKLPIRYALILVLLHSVQKETQQLQWSSQNAEKLRTSKGDYWNKQRLSSTAPLFKMGTILKERICSQREQILSIKSSSLLYGKSLLQH